VFRFCYGYVQSDVTTSLPYLRIGELAQRTGVSPELLRAWERRYGLLVPSRSDGGFRLYSDDDVDRVRRMSDHIADGVSAAEAATLAVRDALEPTGGAPSPGPEALLDALLRLDDVGANRELDRQLAVLSVEAVVQGTIVPALREIGVRWERGEVSVAEEHFASNVLRARLLAMARGWDEGLGPIVVLACVPGEQHDLPLVVLGLGLRDRGWRVTFLGADTPIAGVTGVAERVGARAVVLAALEPALVRAAHRELRALAAQQQLVLGGPGVTKDVATRLGASYLDADLATAADALTDLVAI
jgi:DNA-binding transcriptional MerR regulator